MKLPTMNAKEFSALLAALNACEEAREWAKGKSLAGALRACTRGDWMLWLLGMESDKPGWLTRPQVVLLACACAERTLKHVPKGEDRPRLAIEAARRWAHDPTDANREAAARAAASASARASASAASASAAAWAAASASASAWASAAAWAAAEAEAASAWAASAARAAAWAAWAAGAAAWAAAAAEAEAASAEHRAMCDIIRREIKAMKSQ